MIIPTNPLRLCFLYRWPKGIKYHWESMTDNGSRVYHWTFWVNA
jgi:hypothetical protein